MWLGPLAILIIWVTYCLVYLRHDRQGHTTLSGVVASTRRAYWTFLIGMLVSGILIFLFFKLWLVNVLALPSLVIWLVGLVALVFQPIVAIIPMSGGIKTRVHDFAAYAEGLFIAVIALFIAQSRQLPTGARVVCWLLFLFMIYLAREFKRNLLKPKFIRVQAMYAASFHVIVLIAITAYKLTN